MDNVTRYPGHVKDIRNRPTRGRGNVYIFHAIGTSRYKIGMCRRLVESRLQDIATSSPFPIELVAHREFQRPTQAEMDLSSIFKHHRVHREWFEFDDDLLEDVVFSLDGLWVLEAE